MNLVAGIGTLVIAGFGFWMTYRVVTQTRRTRAWPTADGFILERGTMEMGRGHAPFVSYTYRVGGRDYVNDRFTPIGNAGSTSKSGAQKRVEALHEPLTVRFDPDDPTQSYLYPTPGWWLWVLPVMSLFAVFIGLVFLLSA